MSLSDRQHDAFDNPAKALCRAGNLRALREAAHLLWEESPLTPGPSPPEGRGEKMRLRCDWCELMGGTGLLTLDMLEREGVLAAGGFVGVDLDAARIDGLRRGRPVGVFGALEIYRGKEGGHRMASPRVALR